MDKLIDLFSHNIWALVPLAGMAYAAFAGWMRHQERMEELRQGKNQKD